MKSVDAVMYGILTTAIINTASGDDNDIGIIANMENTRFMPQK